jgi:hypothetical protein
MKNIEQNNTASAREAAEDGISENSRPELGARTKQWSDFGVSLGQIEAWALALSWNLVMSRIFSHFLYARVCRSPLPFAVNNS